MQERPRAGGRLFRALGGGWAYFPVLGLATATVHAAVAVVCVGVGASV